MSGTVRRVGIRLGLEGAREVERGLREVGDSGGRSLAQILRSSEAASAALRLLGPVLGGLSAGAVATFTLNALRAVGGLGELAQQAGVSTDALQVLTFAAVGAGASWSRTRLRRRPTLPGWNGSAGWWRPSTAPTSRCRGR